jgi:hypothetical protein
MSEYDRMMPAKKQKSNFGSFKLADEAQMGGLNSLMNQTYESKIGKTPLTVENNNF